MANVRGVRLGQVARRPSGFGGFLATVFGFLFAGSMLTILIVLAIWPGEVKLLAPLFCTDAQPDAFVVTDTYSVQPGETSVDYTLYCMGPGGDATDHGFFLPFMATMALNTLVLVLIVGAFAVVGRLRTRTKGAPEQEPEPEREEPGRSGPPEGSTAGPFVN